MPTATRRPYHPLVQPGGGRAPHALALILMDALWDVAKVRSLDHAPLSQVRWINGGVLDALSKIEKGGPIQTWRRQVATEIGYPPPG